MGVFSATSLLLARGKGKTIPLKLVSSAGTGFFYTTRKNPTKVTHKMAFVKYDPIVRQRVLFTEAKIK
jgi:large subunit ribosomal protein L33